MRRLAVACLALAGCFSSLDENYESPGRPALAAGGGNRLALWYEEVDLVDLMRATWVGRPAPGAYADRYTVAELTTGASFDAPVLGFAAWRDGPDRLPFVMAWEDGASIELRYLSGQGTPVATNRSGRAPALVAVDGVFVLAYIDGGVVRATRMDVGTTILTSGQADVSSAGVTVWCPAAAVVDNEVLVVWLQGDDVGGATERHVYGAVYELVGATVRAPFPIATGAEAGCPHAAAVGSHYLVTWQWRTGEDVAVATVAQDAAGPTQVLARGGYDPILVDGGDRALLVWDGSGVHARFVAEDLTAGDEMVIAEDDGFDYGHAPAAVFDGERFLVAWRDEDSIHTVDVTGDGQVLRPTGFYSCRAAPGAAGPGALALIGLVGLIAVRRRRAARARRCR